MVSTMNQLLSLILRSQGFKVVVALLILAIGFGIAKLIPRIRRWFLEKTIEEEVEKIKESRRITSWLGESIVIIIAILLSLAFLNAQLTTNLLNNALNYTPSVLTTILIVILGFVVANVITDFVRRFLKTFRTEEGGGGISPKFLDLTVTGIKIFLYIIIVEIAATQIGFSWRLLGNTLTAASYAVVFLLALVAFFGFKDLIENYAAGIYLKGSKMLRPGKQVKIGEERGEIRNVSNYSTIISTQSGYFMQIPNSVLREKEIYFKRSKAEVETLEDVKRYFSARKPSMGGVASVEIALATFGYDLTEDEIEEVIVGEEGSIEELEVSHEDYEKAVEDLTNQEVKTGWIPLDKITNLRDELKAWFNDGALVMLEYEKSVVFPESEASNFVLCVGIEGDEVLVMDPNPESGGVYYVDYRDLISAIEEYENSQGYLVLSPKGSTAYWRVENGLIYSHPNLYEELSKSLEVQLSKILRKSRILKSVMPKSVADFVEKWRSEEKAERVWEPRVEEEE